MKVHHVAFRSAQRQKLVRFYRDVFGLEVVREQPHSTWLAGNEGESVLMIEDSGDEPRVTPHTLELVALSGDEGARSALRDRARAHGVPIEHESELTTYLRDPDGRRLALSSYTFGD